MIMMGLKFMGDVPFRDVYIHALVRDAEGQKMSKSKGNVIDPLHVMEQFGTDALRFTLASMASPGRDIKLAEERIEGYRNFANKIWNAARFALMRIPDDIRTDTPVDPASLSIYDKWILTRMSETIEKVTAEQGAFRLNPAISAIYSFFWNDLCDWYLESIKSDLAEEADPSRRQTASRVFLAVLDAALRLLHPYMPFLTEELYGKLNGSCPIRDLSGSVRSSESIMLAPWPEAAEFPRYNEAYASMELVKTAVSAVRNLRGARNILPKVELTALYDVGEAANQAVLKGLSPLVARLANLRSVRFGVGISSPEQSATEMLPPITLYVPLGELVDLAAERARLGAALEKQRQYVRSVEAKLSNPNFADRAPAEVVAKERERLAELKAIEQKIQRELEAIG
jgi:valyl-tRNA synthetase